VRCVGRPVEDPDDVPLEENTARGSARVRLQPCLLQILTGQHQGRVVLARTALQFSPMDRVPLRPGRLLRVNVQSEDGAVREVMILRPPVRGPALAWLVAGLTALAVLVLGLRGAAFAAAVALTAAATAFVLMPLVSGRLPVAAGLGAYMVLVAGICIFLGGGAGRHALAAILGATLGLAVAAALVWFSPRALGLRGLASTWATYIHQALSPDTNRFDFTRLLVCGATVMVLGLALDVGVSVASGVRHVADTEPGADRRRLLDVGLGLSRDITGTMILTLVFVWVGARVHVLLLPWAVGATPRELLNSESLAADVVRVAAATVGLAVTGPATALVASALGISGGGARRARRANRFRVIGLWALTAALAVLAGGLVWTIGQEAEAAGGLPLVGDLKRVREPEFSGPQDGVKQAHKRLRTGDLDEAAVILWAVIRRDPAHGPAHRALARVYATRGWHVLAAAQIEEALALMPGDSESHYIAGVVAAWRGRPEEARRHLVEALAIDPENEEAARALGALFEAP
jgi:uncharacterized membrane protein